MRWRIVGLVVSLLIVAGSVRVPPTEGRIVVGVSTVNVAFLPIYLTQDRGLPVRIVQAAPNVATGNSRKFGNRLAAQ